jgi:hypothetical protein
LNGPTRDLRRAMTVPKRLEAGSVWVNAYRPVSHLAPFGGVKASGIGRENGIRAVYEYLESKSVFINPNPGVENPFVLSQAVPCNHAGLLFERSLSTGATIFRRANSVACPPHRGQRQTSRRDARGRSESTGIQARILERASLLKRVAATGIAPAAQCTQRA